MLKLKDSEFENVSFYRGSYYENWKTKTLKQIIILIQIKLILN